MRVEGSEIRTGRAYYRVVSALGGEQSEQAVWRRFSEFVALRNLLIRQHPGRQAEIEAIAFPKKTRLKSRGKQESVVTARRAALNAWLFAIAALCPHDALLLGFLSEDLQRMRMSGANTGIDAEMQLLQLATAWRASQQRIPEAIPPTSSSYSTSSSSAAAAGSIEHQLPGLGIGTLSRRALELHGVTQAEVLAAQDSSAPKSALVALILEKTPSPPAAAVETPTPEALLRVELSSLGLGSLSKRAREMGVGEAALIAAQDSDEPTAALIELVVARAELSDPVQRLRQELVSLKLGSLSKRAAEAGVTERAILGAQDSDTPKEALVALILKRQAAATSPDVYAVAAPPARADEMKAARPHYGAPAAQATAKNSVEESLPHCMLSYQWEIQQDVIRVRHRLNAEGIDTWMDIDNGMDVDLYDSMAEGVTKSACVVCFMTQQYQDSTNCQSELKFARDKNVPIVPVMFQGGGWRADGWLGLVTAGMLWVPFIESDTFEQSLAMLLEQVSKYYTAANGVAGAAPAPRLADATESGGDVMRTVVAGDDDSPGSGLAELPAEVPHLAANVRLTDDMVTLKTLVLAADDGEASKLEVSSQKSRIGAHGMGGIGKTVLAALLARDIEVREHFDAIMWITLSQTPDIGRQLQLLHLQASGRELTPGKTPEEVRQLVMDAVKSRNVLLILDDVWDAAHERALNVVDSSTSSKVLVTTRICGLLDTDLVVEIGLPSQEQALEMLCRSAGMRSTWHRDSEADAMVPPEAAEVVELCGRLPLALDICGRLVSDMRLDPGDWAGVPDHLRREMAAVSCEETSLEYRIISTSMKAIPERDRHGCTRVFWVMATVAEDQHVPPDAFHLMFNAVSGEEPVPPLQLRKWIQCLLNRSLILNNWERPQLHDITREWAISQHTETELVALQRKIVGAFHTHKPPSQFPEMFCAANGSGLPAWQSQSPCAEYVRDQVQHHIRQALPENVDSSTLPCVSEWLTALVPAHFNPGYTSMDCQMQVALAKVLGLEQLQTMATRSVQRLSIDPDDCLRALMSLEAVGQVMFNTYGIDAFSRPELPESIKAFFAIADACLEHFDASRKPSICNTEHFAFCLTRLLNNILWLEPFFEQTNPAFLPMLPKDMSKYEERARTLSADCGNASDRERLHWRETVMPVIARHDLDSADSLVLSLWQQRAALVSAGPAADGIHGMLEPMRLIPPGYFVIEMMMSYPTLLRLPEFSWNFLEADGKQLGLLERGVVAWDPDMEDTVHTGTLINMANLPNCFIAFCFLRGELTRSEVGLQHFLKYLTSVGEIPVQQIVRPFLTGSNWVFSMTALTWFAPYRRRLAPIFSAFGFSCSTADALMEANSSTQKGTWRCPSDPRSPGKQLSVQIFTWGLQCDIMLVRGFDDDAEACLGSFPDPDTMEEELMIEEITCTYRLGYFNPFLAASDVWALRGEHERSLQFARKVLREDLGAWKTDQRPPSIVRAHTSCGTALAALGQLAEAEAAFDAAISISRSCGMRTLELLALRGLHDGVPLRSAQALEAAKAVLELMTVTQEMLAELLEGSTLLQSIREIRID